MKTTDHHELRTGSGGVWSCSCGTTGGCTSDPVVAWLGHVSQETSRPAVQDILF